MAGEAQRFFLVHIPKTAGTSLRNRFRNHFPVDAIYPNGNDRDQARPRAEFVAVDLLLDAWARRGQELRFIHGHFPLSVVDLIDADFVTMSVLRPPVERTLSLLRHRKVVSAAHQDLTLEEIYDDPIVFSTLIVNSMTRALGLRTADYGDQGLLTTVAYDDALLERAKAGLASLDLYGLQPHFEDFCTELSARYGLDLGDPVRSNTTEPMAPTDELVERITADNALDLALYDHAVELYEQRRPDWIT